MKCPRCGYEWKPKISQPKECPRCKGRMDYLGVVGVPKIKKGGEKEMTSKLPWATVAVIIVIAAIGAWALYGTPAGEVTPPVGQPGTISLPTAGGIAFAGGIPTYSGIENVYIMQHGLFENTENLSGHENLQSYQGNTAVIEDTGLPAENVPYENYFDIVVAVRGASENMAYVNTENMYVRLVISNAFSDDENTLTTGKRYQFAILTDTWIRVNHLFDNDGNGYKLGAGENIDLTVYYYCYK
ncbi:MAG: hypothetical protein KAV43_05755 [Hadesarchaea archaeon]|nr:hypothetical protein [Hadesarchaea archaeon]